MKKMIQRMIGLAAALSVVLSVTAVVCSAHYEYDSGEEMVAPCSDIDRANSDRN